MKLWELRDYVISHPFGTRAAQYLLDHYNLFVRGKTYQRKDIAAALARKFKEEGGDPNTSNSAVTRVLKKLLQHDASPFRKIDRGLYTFEGGSNQDNIGDEPPGDTESSPSDEILPEQEYGEGPCEVYAWCLPRYRTAASGPCWPIKIGQAGKEGFRRRLEDFAANLPERPCYLMRLRCIDDSEARYREKLLHHYFQERDDKVVEGIAGKEWFKTNPNELDKAIRDLFPRAHRAARR